MASAGSLEVGQELHGLANLAKLGQVRNLFSGVREEDDWQKHEELLLSFSSPCVPSMGEEGRQIASIQQDTAAACLAGWERPVQVKA